MGYRRRGSLRWKRKDIILIDIVSGSRMNLRFFSDWYIYRRICTACLYSFAFIKSKLLKVRYPSWCSVISPHKLLHQLHNNREILLTTNLKWIFSLNTWFHRHIILYNKNLLVTTKKNARHHICYNTSQFYLICTLLFHYSFQEEIRFQIG